MRPLPQTRCVVAGRALVLVASAVAFVLSAGMIRAAQPPTAKTAAPASQTAAPPLSLADFEEPQALQLSAHGASAQRIERGAGHVLEIRTQAGVDYPSVTLQPPAGRWDLSPYEEVQLRVRNPEDAPLRVLLSIANPGADGRKHCNTESVAVPPQGEATLTVPFGSWHGELGHELDLKNIVAATVLLDRPDRAHRFIVDDLRAAAFDRGAMQAIYDDPFFRTLRPPFGRGINLANALEAPREGQWGVTLAEEDFAIIARSGFDSIRLPVCWSAHADQAPPYAIDPAFFARVDWALAQARRRGLTVVLNMHHYDELFADPAAHAERFVALWRQIGGHYRGQPDSVAFELLNEPHDQLTAERWNKLLVAALGAVRRENPTRRVVIGPTEWNSIRALDSLVLPEDDRHLVATVHFYDPFRFTHQGATWAGPGLAELHDQPWLGTPSERRQIERAFDQAITWAVRHRRPLYLGEFGAYSTGDMQSRARWTRCVVDEAVRRKMGFAYWEFRAGFGAYDPQRGQWHEPLRKALLSQE